MGERRSASDSSSHPRGVCVYEVRCVSLGLVIIDASVWCVQVCAVALAVGVVAK